MNTKVIEGDRIVRDARFAIVAARFNDFIVARLIDGATHCLTQHGATAADIDVIRVPGAYEMPLAVKKVAESRQYQAIIALGAVIRGATPHFDFVAGESARGVAKAGLDNDLPVAFGILTVDTIEQAIERAGTKAGNKGEEAALSAIEMVNLLRKFD